MKTVVFLGLVIILCANCKKRQVERKGCQSPPTEIVYDSGWAFIPNIITANGDGVNDFLIINMVGQQSFSLDIKRRKNGNPIFHTNDPNTSWTGEVNGKIKEGIYYYDYSILTTNGVSVSGIGEICVVVKKGDYCISNGANCSTSGYWNGTEFVKLIDAEDFICN